MLIKIPRPAKGGGKTKVLLPVSATGPYFDTFKAEINQ